MPDFKSKYSGLQIDDAVTIALGLNIINNGWLRVPSSEEYPVDLNLLMNVGNFTIGYFINGSEFMMTTKPLNISVLSINDIIYQYSLIKDNIEYRKYENGAWTPWGTSKSSSYIYQQPEAPLSVDTGAIWIDTHLPNGPYPIKILDENGWIEITPSNMMDITIYDTTGIATDLYEAIQAYIEDFKNTNNLGNIVNDLNNHITDSVLHTSLEEKNTWNNKETPESAQTKVDIALAQAKTYTDQQIAGAVAEAGTIGDGLTAVQTSFNTHNNDAVRHITGAERTSWNSKAEGNHGHNSDGKVKIDASNIVSGVLALARIPSGALERITKVADNAARFALTTAQVQAGDSVYVTDVKEFYFVVDDTKLNIEAGYQLYSSGVASSVLWSNIKNKPTTISGYGITDAYDKTQVDGIANGITTELETYTDQQIDILDTIIKLNFIKNTNLVTTRPLYGMAYGNGVYVFISSSYNIFRSTDLVTFTEQTLSTGGNSLFSITFGNGQFVIVGQGKLILTSPDGITWTQQSVAIGASDWINCIKFLNNTFIAVGDVGSDYQPVIITSPDGITWTKRTAPEPDNSGNLQDVVYGDGKYIAIGNYGNILISTDLITWNAYPIPSSNILYLKSVTYGNGIYVVVGEERINSKENRCIYTSSDGITWTQRIEPSPIMELSSIIFSTGLFISVGWRSTVDYIYSGIIYTSTNGITWDELIIPNLKYLFRVVYINNYLYLLGDKGELLYSPINRSTIVQSIGNLNDEIVPVKDNINELCYNISGQKNLIILQESLAIASLNQIRLINAETNVMNLTEKVNESLTLADSILNLLG